MVLYSRNYDKGFYHELGVQGRGLWWWGGSYASFGSLVHSVPSDILSGSMWQARRPWTAEVCKTSGGCESVTFSYEQKGKNRAGHFTLKRLHSSSILSRKYLRKLLYWQATHPQDMTTSHAAMTRKKGCFIVVTKSQILMQLVCYNLLLVSLLVIGVVQIEWVNIVSLGKLKNNFLPLF